MVLPELDEIAKRRKALGYTQRELAKRADVKRNTLGKIETKHQNPSYKLAKQIFDTLESLEKERMINLKSFTIGEIHNTPIEFVDVSDTIYDVWKRMENTSFSQFPVKYGNDIVGSITERDINKSIMSGGTKKLKYQPISDIMEDPFPTISINMSVVGVISLLHIVQAVLTSKGNKIVGIVTNSDIGKIFRL
jgi:predicted transcriptional regulator